MVPGFACTHLALRIRLRDIGCAWVATEEEAMRTRRTAAGARSRSGAGGTDTPTIVRYSPEQGTLVLQVGGRRERYAHALSPEQHMTIGSYHRARRGFATDVEMAEALGVHRTRIAAWKRGQAPDPENAHLLSNLATVVEELLRFLDSEIIADWLTAPQYELGEQAPIEALRQGRLADVLQAANASEHGAYV
jgi:transcriptional regulator with XRE-family HTH domain